MVCHVSFTDRGIIFNLFDHYITLSSSCEDHGQRQQLMVPLTGSSFESHSLYLILSIVKDTPNVVMAPTNVPCLLLFIWLTPYGRATH